MLTSVSAHIPNTASLFLRKRSHASCQSEFPCSIGSAITAARVEVVGDIGVPRITRINAQERRMISDAVWIASLAPAQDCSCLQPHFRVHPSLDDIDDEIQPHDQHRVENHGAK